MTRDVQRRKWRPCCPPPGHGRIGACEDCGQHRNVTTIRWWIGGQYVVCTDCIKPYRHVILGRTDA